MSDTATRASEWAWSTDHRQLCQIIEAQTIWGETIWRVWLPDSDSIVRVPASSLIPLESIRADSPDNIAYAAAASRVADALTHDMLLAPVEASVIPLPHQIRALSRAVSNHRVRYLLADEVGLGKTIEAGLIMRELKLRGMVNRTLVIAPRGLVTQWVAEMQTHFGEEFRLLIPSDFWAYRRIAQDDNLWRTFHQVICSMDSVKPLDRRRGWSKEQIAEYNRERFEDLISGGWDLVIVDEAHRLGGSTDQVARYKLGQGLAEVTPYLLLLSATPHQGKTDSFHRLVSLIDSEAFPDIGSVSRERVRPYVIRTEKRQAIDAEGKPLFKPRFTQLVPVGWEERHKGQQILYNAVTEYVREGYNRAINEKQRHIGFLMILMQRLVVSSTRAIRMTLERRLEALEIPDDQLTLFPQYSEQDWADLDGQEQIDALITSRSEGLRNERSEVNLLLRTARQCEQAGPDVKADALLDWIYRLQQEEGDSDLKFLIFTEFVGTQEMLREFLTDRGFSVACLNGSMDMDERKEAQESFAKKVRILVSTDAGGEGLNLQFCHVVVNYDIPWNPMRLEQRIGRVDRIGQDHPVRAINFVFEDSVEYRVREVLEEKLAVILEEFGIDKTGDVLDSAEAGHVFDDLYIEAILHPENIESRVEDVANNIRLQAKESRETLSVYGTSEVLDPAVTQGLIAHPLPHWVERMTVSYLKAHGGKASLRGSSWTLVWPDGHTVVDAVFNPKDFQTNPAAEYLTLENPIIRNLATRPPRFVDGQPMPVVNLPALPSDVQGFWSLWKIAVHAEDWARQRIMPLFLHDDDRCLVPTARRIWEELISTPFDVRGQVDGHRSQQVFRQLLQVAEDHGKSIYQELKHDHQQYLLREREKGAYAFSARRRVMERVGLSAVRTHRMDKLALEQKTWRDQLEKKAEIVPELLPLIMVRINGGPCSD